MSCFDAFILPVKTAHLEDYRILAVQASRIWHRLGALEVVEAEGEGLEPGKLTSFPRAVLLEEDETVIWSFIRFRDRAHRDEVVAAAMADPELMAVMDVDWIDGKRMIWGVFKGIAET